MLPVAPLSLPPPQLTNVVSFFISLFGFSFLVHRVGVKFSLLVFPSLLLVATVVTNLAPSLWVLFSMVSIVKALCYSFFEPVKELLYIPTSQVRPYLAPYVAPYITRT